MIKVKLDSCTNKAWESTIPRNSIPAFKELTDFLDHRCQILNDVSIDNMLRKGGFELRKWSSNCPKLLHSVSNSDNHTIIDIDKDTNIKTLGLQWNSFNDMLSYFIPLQAFSERITKRSILSFISKIFDPLGLLGPVIIVAKGIMQILWQLKLSWDESVPSDVHSKWFNFIKKIPILENIKIPRCVKLSKKIISIEIHGLCDASEFAYGAAIYVRTFDSVNYFSNLLCAKSRVAQLKNISLPKLELCGALLLAQLMNKVINSLIFSVSNIYYWTDSTIALSWIKSPSRSWKTFVANRVAEIQEISNINNWKHVNTTNNPADIISRGISPEDLQKCTFWWQGPAWLRRDNIHWPSFATNSASPEEIPERRIIALTSSTTNNDNIFTKYSDFDKLIRIIAYCLRYKNNVLSKMWKQAKIVQGQLTLEELNKAELIFVKQVQIQSFSTDINQLQKYGVVSEKTNLLFLHPFLDKMEIIRVGGRLKNSTLSYAVKHPAILPKGHPVTKLIIKREHLRNLHAGNQSTLSAIRCKYWPIGAINTIKEVIRKCVICFKVKPIHSKNFMGDLPASRLTPARPFTNCGVDYFGPLYVREGKRRNSKVIKMYGAVFICFAVKAVHIELVSDLSTDTFISALKRFISRRGKPQNMYSDNGTNFVGANKELQDLTELFCQDSSKNKIISAMSAENITWHFIPPRSPHFGGIWEAAVKKFKFHIRRIAGNSNLHHEEMVTLLVQIESILNSRPLTPLSSDPNDMSCLTPGHFLIGDCLTAINEVNLNEVPLNRLSLWQHVENLRQHFWRRWQRKYLHHFQQRIKWKSSTSPKLQVDQLVLIQDDNLPPLRWLLGRIEVVHPGKDGFVRAATIRTSSGIIKRACTKLCPLPIDTD